MAATAPSSRSSTPAISSDPASVDASWRSYFDELGPESRGLFEQTRTAQKPRRDGGSGLAQAQVGAEVVDLSSERSRRLIIEHLRVVMLIRAFRVRGHLLADLDPLGLAGDKHHPELDPTAYGFSEADLDREFFLDNVLGLEKATLRKIVEILRQTYSARIGVEFMHIQDPDQKSWIQVQMEGSHNLLRPSAEAKREILDQLTAAEGFERFLHVKFPGTKRFGLDGGESTVPALESIVRRSAELGVDEVVIGMSHRGRLNVLANVMGKPYTAIFSEFQGGSAPDDVLGSGDVKYHLGTSTDRELPDGRKVHLSLTANPSHLEAVNPVVFGKVRAKQRQKGDTERSRVMGLLLHGDAAFAGQGVVQEGLEMSELRGFRTGGTIHVIVNNQIGFTTSPAYARSSPYPSDVARAVQSPIFHVNGDDPEAVVLVGAHGRRVPPALQEGRGDRSVVLPPPRPQRGRRAELHPAADVPHDRAASDHAADLHTPAERGRRARGGRGPAHLRRLPGAPVGRARGRGRLQDQQGGLAGGRLDRPEPGAGRL